MSTNDQTPADRTLRPVVEGYNPERAEELRDTGEESFWKDKFGPVDQPRLEANRRLFELDRVLNDLWETRELLTPELYPVPPETLKPGYMGPEEDGYPEHFNNGEDMVLANIGQLIAALGGHLELNAVFPDATITVLVEPGPERFPDASEE